MFTAFPADRHVGQKLLKPQYGHMYATILAPLTPQLGITGFSSRDFDGPSRW